MLNSTIVIKIKQRVNKLDSQDYDNIECWQIVEAFNKAQVEWIRRQLHGTNPFKEGDEASNRRKDDLQKLLVSENLTLGKRDLHYASSLPGNYLAWKRVDVYANKECCDKRKMVVYLAEEDDLAYRLLDIPTSKDKLPLYAELNKLFCAFTAPQPIKNINTKRIKA